MNTAKIWNRSALVGILAFVAGCGEKAEKSSVAVEEAEVDAAAVEGFDFEDATIKDSYVIGLGAGQSMARNLESLEGTGIQFDVDTIAQAFAEGLVGEAQMDEEAVTATMNDFRSRVSVAMTEKRKAEQLEADKVAQDNLVAGQAFLAENKTQEGIVTLESGLQYRIVAEGDGASPSASDRVKVHYTGTLVDGTKFDSSRDRGEPSVFGVSQVIKGWTEALQLMKEGSAWTLYIPSDIAYGKASRPKIPGNSVLVFDVELIEVVK